MIVITTMKVTIRRILSNNKDNNDNINSNNNKNNNNNKIDI